MGAIITNLTFAAYPRERIYFESSGGTSILKEVDSFAAFESGVLLFRGDRGFQLDTVSNSLDSPLDRKYSTKVLNLKCQVFVTREWLSEASFLSETVQKDTFP